jgi:hypothetical protein
MRTTSAGLVRIRLIKLGQAVVRFGAQVLLEAPRPQHANGNQMRHLSAVASQQLNLGAHLSVRVDINKFESVIADQFHWRRRNAQGVDAAF